MHNKNRIVSFWILSIEAARIPFKVHEFAILFVVFSQECIHHSIVAQSDVDECSIGTADRSRDRQLWNGFALIQSAEAIDGYVLKIGNGLMKGRRFAGGSAAHDDPHLRITVVQEHVAEVADFVEGVAESDHYAIVHWVVEGASYLSC